MAPRAMTAVVPHPIHLQGIRIRDFRGFREFSAFVAIHPG